MPARSSCLCREPGSSLVGSAPASEFTFGRDGLMDHKDSAPAAPAGRSLGGSDMFPQARAAPDTGPEAPADTTPKGSGSSSREPHPLPGQSEQRQLPRMLEVWNAARAARWWQIWLLLEGAHLPACRCSSGHCRSLFITFLKPQEPLICISVTAEGLEGPWRLWEAVVGIVGSGARQK